MNTPTHFPSLPRAARLSGAIVTATLLVACGGGGDGSPAGEPTVSSAVASPVKYSQSLLVTINGSGLDSGLSVGSAGCKGMARSTVPSEVSTASTAYYRCTASSLGANTVNVARASDGAILKTAAFAVAVPQVTMAVRNGAGVDGLMVFTLAPDKAQATVDNFLAYVNSGFYDGTVFHRVVTNFVVQGGGYLPITPGAAPVLQAPLRAAIPLEVGRGLSNTQWSIAMARTGEPNSATSQFFINAVNNSAILDPHAGSDGYAVFGTVSAGTAVASAILGAPCAPLAGFSECVPNPNVVIAAALQTQ